MPKLWTATIDGHRREVRQAIIDAAIRLVGEHGLRGVTMSLIAHEAGIGRATLYKYFPDVEAILSAWHEQRIAEHLEILGDVAGTEHPIDVRLRAFLDAYAMVVRASRGHHDAELAAALHHDQQVVVAERQLRELARRLLTEAAAAGVVRTDTGVDELVDYCLHALGAARSLHRRASIDRLVAMTFDGLRA